MPASALHAGDRRVRAQVKAADASPLRRLAAAAATADSALLFFILDRSVSPLRPPSALCTTRTSTRYTLPVDPCETLKPAGPAQDRSRRGRQPIGRATVRGQPETCYMVRWAAPRLLTREIRTTSESRSSGACRRIRGGRLLLPPRPLAEPALGWVVSVVAAGPPLYHLLLLAGGDGDSGFDAERQLPSL